MRERMMKTTKKKKTTTKVRGTTSVSIKITSFVARDCSFFFGTRIAIGWVFGLVGASVAHRRLMPHGSADK